jgi:hypothetical protein
VAATAVRAGAGLFLLSAMLALGSCGGGGGRGPADEPSGPVADQVFTTDPDSFALTSGVPAEKAQTFTVGVTGHLVRIEVLSMRDANHDVGELLCDVRATFLGAPEEDDDDVLAGVSIPATAISDEGGLLVVDLPAPGVLVAAGTRLAVVFRAANDGRFTIAANGNDGYGQGAHYARNPEGGVDRWIVLPGADIGFATYVTRGP